MAAQFSDETCLIGCELLLTLGMRNIILCLCSRIGSMLLTPTKLTIVFRCTYSLLYLSKMTTDDQESLLYARVGQVLRRENVEPRVAAKFFKAVVQAVLLYGSETWNLSKAALARLEGFNIRAAYKMAKTHRPKRGANGVWEYPSSKDVLEECGLRTIENYIRKRRDTIAIYVATRPILEACRQGDRQRGSMPRQWWWEQPMTWSDDDATGSDTQDDAAAGPYND